jgi:hypothetical protein
MLTAKALAPGLRLVNAAKRVNFATSCSARSCFSWRLRGAGGTFGVGCFEFWSMMVLNIRAVAFRGNTICTGIGFVCCIKCSIGLVNLSE